jgi:hypothetical protein
MTWLPLKGLFDLLQPLNILYVLAALFTEQRIVFYSRSLQRLTYASQANAHSRTHARAARWLERY